MSTPREEANTLLKGKGLEQALSIARARYWDDIRTQQSVSRSIAIVEHLERLANIIADLRCIERADPVADLAAKLIKQGVTEHELHAALGTLQSEPIGNEFYNKYRSIARGVPTYNHYKVRRPCRRKP